MRAVARIAPFLDHTLLAPEATAPDIEQLCDEAVRHGMAPVCVLDMVASPWALWALTAGDWRYAERDVAETVRAADGALVKVIIESALLTPQEIIRACEVARDGGAGFVKTSTGYHAGPRPLAALGADTLGAPS